MRKNISIIIVIILIILAVFGAFSYNLLDQNSEDNQAQSESNTVIKLLDETLNGEDDTESAEVQHLRDVDTLYEEEDETDVVTMYLTVRTGNPSEGTDHTWEEVNSYSAYYYNEEGIDRYKVEALLQVGTEEGIAPGNLGYGLTASNATVQIRGQTSSRNAQKNYKIELKENQGNWNGQTTIALNKHQTDGLRFRNKMGFDMLKDVEQLMSLRTHFVHLYVNDLTDGSDDGFEDYGLYTQVEQLNKTALRSHGLDNYGHLYKVNFFEFFRYEDAIKLQTDPTFDKAVFEQYLEIKGDTDHTKLIEMLEAVNDTSIPIDDVIDKYFDRENLLYWLAFNIITGNVDTQSRNCYLYSPQNEERWYFLCWDLDGMLRKTENDIQERVDYGSWESGVSNYWGNVLFQRALKSESFREELDLAINDLRSIFTKEKIADMVATYRGVVEETLWETPDITHEQLTPEEYEQVANSLPDLADTYYECYLQSLENPLPFYIGDPVIEEDKLKIVWDNSYDFQQQDIMYTAVISRDLEGTDVVDKYEGIWPEWSTDKLEPGAYFLKVQSMDTDGNIQDAFDYYELDGYGKVYGIKYFFVNEDDTIDMYTVTE